jgi:hypothetical protein
VTGPPALAGAAENRSSTLRERKPEVIWANAGELETVLATATTSASTAEERREINIFT